jgi:hypothetical protein
MSLVEEAWKLVARGVWRYLDGGAERRSPDKATARVRI